MVSSIYGGIGAINIAFAKALTDALAPDSSDAMDIADHHRQHISR